MVTDKMVICAIETVAEYCKQQTSCQNCILRVYGAERWKCTIDNSIVDNVLANKDAKKKGHGYI